MDRAIAAITEQVKLACSPPTYSQIAKRGKGDSKGGKAKGAKAGAAKAGATKGASATKGAA